MGNIQPEMIAHMEILCSEEKKMCLLPSLSYSIFLQEKNQNQVLPVY